MTEWSGPHGPHYAPPRPDTKLLKNLAPSADVRLLRIPLMLDEGWSWLNPSVCATDGQLLATVRASNFTIGANGEYVITGDGVTITTRNGLLTISDDLTVSSWVPLPSHPPGPPLKPAPVDGCEDLRLFRHDGDLYATCAVWDRGDGVAEQGLWDIRNNRLDILHAPEDGPQKNWMPFRSGGHLNFLYRVEPCITLTLDRGATVIAGWTTAHDDQLAYLRGGSQGLYLNGSWFFVVHEACIEPRTYTHRVVEYREHHIVNAGPRWRFTTEPVEFCCGATMWDGKVLLSFGIGERACGLASLPTDQFVALGRS